VYLLTIHIPIYVEEARYFVAFDWQRDLLLTRDWLGRAFGGLTLLAPSLPLSAVDAAVMQVAPIGLDDGIRVVPSFDLRCRAREFWRKQRHEWLSDVRRELRQARVIQAAMTNIYRPLAFMAHREGVRAGVPTVFLGPDMDVHARFGSTLRGRFYCMIYDQIMRRAGRSADITLLKEGLVYERYASYCKNARAFCHTMYSARDVIGETKLEKRLETLGGNRTLRVVYAGRFVARKGLREAIAAIAEARRRGTTVEYHLYGSGPEEESLRRQAKDLGIEDLIFFHGYVEYGPQFIAQLAEYDLLLFLPTEEDTPRMLYDAMAAGLPLVGSRIPFLGHRVRTDEIGVLSDVGDNAGAAEHLVRLGRDPERLKAFARSARLAAQRHSIEEWYRRRAAWIQEAANQVRLGQGKDK
jgi:glycosyltransferase involved in cell wall biosynthesis